MAASIAANTPSNTIDREPESRPNTTPNSATTTVTPIDSRSILCSAAASGMRAESYLNARLQASSPPLGERLGEGVTHQPSMPPLLASPPSEREEHDWAR